LDLLNASGSPRLQLLATSTQLAAFDKVKTAITDLIAELKQKLGDDVKKRDYCLSSFDKNDRETQETEYLMEDLDNTKQQLVDEIKKLDESIKATREAIESLKIDIASATQTRKEENKQYQQVYSDQTVTTKILLKAKQRLEAFYNAPKEFMQQPGGPVGLKKGGYEKRNSTGVVGMIAMIIEDSEKTKALAIEDEKNASAAYEKFLGDAKKSMGDLKKSLTSSMESRAETAEKHQETKEDLKDAMATLESLQKEKAGLHKDCDFLIKNFDETQVAMGQEIEALQQAISILSGAQ
jgi:chromosome segregation ATPase